MTSTGLGSCTKKVAHATEMKPAGLLHEERWDHQMSDLTRFFKKILAGNTPVPVQTAHGHGTINRAVCPVHKMWLSQFTHA